jgi:hypothetical protein
VIGSGVMWPRRAALIAFLALSGCGFDSRSGQFACEPDGDCDDGRVCVDGWCVVEGAMPAADADVGPFTCSDISCTLTCTDENPCAFAIECPDSRPCIIQCSGAGSCSREVDCGSSSDCQVTCSGVGSCGQEVDCDNGSCEILCVGIASCAGPVDCDDACACRVSCEGEGACGSSNSCSRQQCADGNECIATGGPCDQC